MKKIIFVCSLVFCLTAIASWWNWSETEDEYSPLPQNYERWSGCEKQNEIWDNRIVQTKYETLPKIKGADKWSFLTLSKKFLRVSFDLESDQMPAKRKKLVRPFGTTAKIQFQSTGAHPFTGLYQGAECGLIRFTVVDKPSKGFSPGVSLKLFRDGVPSGNILAMFSITGQGKDLNIFKNEFSNFIPESKNMKENIIDKVFKRVTKVTTRLGVSHLADSDEKGEKPSGENVSPYQVYFVPADGLSTPRDSKEDFREELGKLEEGTKIYELWGNKKGEERVKIGDIILSSGFVASEYSDRYLFFKHEFY